MRAQWKVFVYGEIENEDLYLERVGEHKRDHSKICNTTVGSCRHVFDS